MLCHKENSESEQELELPRVLIKIFRGAMHSGKKWRGALWLNAMHWTVKSDEFENSSHLIYFP